MKKNIRFQLLLTEQIDEYLNYHAQHMGVKKSELIRRAIFDYCQGNPEVIKCPTCQVPILDRQYIPLEGISEVDCSQGHTHWYDWDEYKWVK